MQTSDAIAQDARVACMLMNARTSQAVAQRRRARATRARRAAGACSAATASIAPPALMLAPCNAVHTAFMRFAIDVVFVDRDGTRRGRSSADSTPWRIAASLRRACRHRAGRRRLPRRTSSRRRSALSGGRRRTPAPALATVGQLARLPLLESGDSSSRPEPRRFSEPHQRRAEVRRRVVPELLDARVPVERGLHDAALHAASASVDDADLAESRVCRRRHVLLDDRRDVRGAKA